MKLRNLVAGLFLMAGFLAVGSANASAEEAAPQAAAPVIYEVQPGDYLSKIATQYQTTYTRLFDANPEIVNPDFINPGQKIRIPAVGEQIAPRAVPQPVQPVARVTKSRVAPRRVAATQPAAAPASGDAWSKLAACESGGRASTNTGNGYYGAYQFTASTWRSVGGSGLPSDASLEEQTARAQALQARSGWGQWPACTAKLGLR